MQTIYLSYRGLNFRPNLTSPGLFNNDISLTQQIKVLAQVSIA